MRNGKAVRVTEWGNDILRGTRAVAELIDRGDGGQDYASAVDAQAALIQDADSTPSARLLEELRTAGCGFFDFAMQAARGHRDYFRSIAPLSVEREAEFAEEAESSLLRQLEIEQSDTLSLDEYLANYFAGT
jgi:glutamate--cysteine ligase